jgi:cell wall-associated NlpC family hydrolase
MVKHTSKQLKVKGYSGKVTWHSSRPSVAAITQKGKIRTKKEGNTVISVKVGTIRLGCILSVTTDRKKKAIRRAQKIASTSTYSQPKRMLKGYYDCSSLVWRAYSKYGYRFGSASYAPTAASQAEYMAQHNKLLKGGFSKGNVENLRIKAGDLLFETGANNGRYKGIYHVEMIAGYEFVGWKNNGKAMVAVKWANRSDGYYGYGAGIVGKM